MNNLRLVLGGPGCGKTTRLLQIVEEEMERGVAAREIAFVAFTKAAAREASERAAEKFGLDAEEDLPWFRTIHSLAYGKLAMTRDEVMTREDWEAFGEIMNEDITARYDNDTGIVTGATGDKLLRVVDYAATTLVSLEEAWHALNEPIGWYKLKQFASALSAYKEDTGKTDFTGMLTTYIERGEPVAVRVAVIDEAQDLTAAQWAAVRRAFSGVERVYVGGDDDQAIYKWAGADVEQFLRLPAEPEVLSKSFRLPRKVFDLGEKIAHRITHRYDKNYQPAEDRVGSVDWHMQPDTVDLRAEGTWLLLARNNYMLAALESMARGLGLNYRMKKGEAVRSTDVEAMRLWESVRARKVSDLSAREVRSLSKALGLPRPLLKELSRYNVADFKDWPLGKPWYEALLGIESERREYYLSCLRRGEKLNGVPRFRIETIHGVKGAEADHVLLLTDMSERTYLSYLAEPDHEHRVFYVAATRARESLHLIRPLSDRFYGV